MYGLLYDEVMVKANPLIILLGGTHAVGKTTLAFELAKLLSIKTIIGLGPIISATGALGSTKQLAQDLALEIGAKNVKRDLCRKARAVGVVVSKIIAKNTETGSPCIIEGVEILPQFLPIQDNLFLCFISLENLHMHAKRLFEPDITRSMQFFKKDLVSVGLLQRLILKTAKEFGIPVFENSGDPKQVSKLILAEIKKRGIKV